MKKLSRKKALSLVLILVMLLNVMTVVPAFAEEGEVAESVDTGVEVEADDSVPDQTEEIETEEDLVDDSSNEVISEEVQEEETELTEVEDSVEEPLEEEDELLTKDEVAEGSLIDYSGHVQGVGNVAAVSDGTVLGLTGKSLRLEAFLIQKGEALADLEGDILYRAHVEGYGNMAWASNGAMMGTKGQSLRVEAIQIYLTGELAEKYDVYYTVHSQNLGWMQWTKGDVSSAGWCGTAGMSLRVEALRVELVEKESGYVPKNNASFSYVTSKNLGTVSYSGHQQGIGDLDTVSDGTKLGVTGKSFRLEALRVQLNSGLLSGGVQYKTHVQNVGWQSWVSDGELSGTTGKSLRVEAIQIQLTGDIAEHCDIWYRTHIQGYGWLGWAKNGQIAGSTGQSLRVESVQIKVVPKVGTAPGANTNYFKIKQPTRVENAVNKVLSSTGKDLYSCYMWCVKNIRYRNLSNSVPSGYTNPEWFGLYGLEQGYGDCRTYAAAFYLLAKNMGYKARYVYGYVPRAGGGAIDHAWVEIDMDGTTYVFDPDFQYETGRNGYKFTYGTSGTWRYQNYHYE